MRKKSAALMLMGMALLSYRADAQLIADYNADLQPLGAATTFTDTLGLHNAIGAGTVANSNATFNGHQYMNFGDFQGFTTSSLFSGADPRSIAAVYTNPVGDNGVVNPIAGVAGDGVGFRWFVLQARDYIVAGDPYVATYFGDVSSGGAPVANRLTFVVGSYDGTTESLYWAYGVNGAVQSASQAYTLNTFANNFDIGVDQAEASQSDMQIGRVQVFNVGMDLSTATVEIQSLQADYLAAVPEPSTWALLATALVGGAFVLRRRTLV